MADAGPEKHRATGSIIPALLAARRLKARSPAPVQDRNASAGTVAKSEAASTPGIGPGPGRGVPPLPGQVAAATQAVNPGAVNPAPVANRPATKGWFMGLTRQDMEAFTRDWQKDKKGSSIPLNPGLPKEVRTARPADNTGGTSLRAPRARAKPDLSVVGLFEGYKLAAGSEGKSPRTIEIVGTAVGDLGRFLNSRSHSTAVTEIGVNELREYLLDLSKRNRFASHPGTPEQEETVSGFTVNTYGRSLQMFFSWLWRDRWITENPFNLVKIPKPPQKEIEIFSDENCKALLAAVDTLSPRGFRDYCMMALLLDSAPRCTELLTITLDSLDIKGRILTVMGKGKKERDLPIGVKVQNALWKYVKKHRPEPASPKVQELFLMDNGYPMKKRFFQKIISEYGEKAGISGVRVSPHTFRHTSLTNMLRNGMDEFTVLRISGHASIESLQRYIHLASADVMKAHGKSSPVDNLDIGDPTRNRRSIRNANTDEPSNSNMSRRRTKDK